MFKFFKLFGSGYLGFWAFGVCPQNSKELLRHITFRDFLRNNPEAVKKYSKVKENGAKLFPYNMDKYIEYKTPCIEEMYLLCGLS